MQQWQLVDVTRSRRNGSRP